MSRTATKTAVAVKRSNRAQLEFLRAELGVSSAFANRALTTKSAEVRERNRLNARKGFDTFVHHLNDVTTNPAEAEVLIRGVERLRSLLRKLGEKV